MPWTSTIVGYDENDQPIYDWTWTEPDTLGLNTDGTYNAAKDSQAANVQIDAKQGTGTAVQGYTTPDSPAVPYGQVGVPVSGSTGSAASTITAGINKLLGTKLTNSDVASWLPLIMGGISATGLGRSTVTPTGYQGKIPVMAATRAQIPAAIAATQQGVRPYGGAAQGRQYFTPTTYTKQAAQGGIMSLAEGGLSEGGFVIPADVVSHLGNGSSNAGLAILEQRFGAEPIRGEGDGMSDSIRTNIDGVRPAKVANDEAYLSPDKVAAIGGGDEKKGAQKLYALMDRIREARTGNKEQGKQINPEKFLPGGKVGYADGGTTTVPAGTTGVESSLSNWAGDYVTNMLGQGAALAAQPYQAYTGQLTAGTSPLSQQAYDQASSWQTPGSVTNAANTLGTLSQTNAGQYNPTTFTNQYNAVTPTATTDFTNQFNAPTVGAGTTQFANQYQAPAAYNAANFSAGTFDQNAAQQYMNPYLQASLAPQIAEARRQADIQSLQDKARLAKAGAYGGSRQAIMESEGNRNLLSNLANITGQGYNTAYNNAMTQFNADQARNMQAQQATEASRQFGAGQAATAAQLQAQYGLSAQQAQEAARQFNAGQQMTAAQLQAQYGLSAQQAQEAARQFNTTSGITQAQNAAQYGQAAQQASEASRQFGANLGLQGLQQQIAAAQGQGNLGLSMGNQQLQGIQQLGTFGQQQQATEQAALDAQKAQFEAERDNPYKMVQFQQSLLQGLPLSAQNYNTAQTSALQELITGAGGVASLLKILGYNAP